VQKSSPNSSKEQDDDAHGLLDLPAFDSLPATAGLDKIEVFRLSVRHALTLLPTLFTQGDECAVRPKNEQRFSLR
jgi:hypothetical protein